MDEPSPIGRTLRAWMRVDRGGIAWVPPFRIALVCTILYALTMHDLPIAIPMAVGAILVVALLVAAVALSACRVDSVVTVDMQRDGSGTITLQAVADAAVVQAAPGLADELRFDEIGRAHA